MRTCSSFSIFVRIQCGYTGICLSGSDVILGMAVLLVRVALVILNVAALVALVALVAAAAFLHLLHHHSHPGALHLTRKSKKWRTTEYRQNKRGQTPSTVKRKYHE